ncbi:hypothetical protein C0J52_03731 [Blattella germanica]|nr:hypothetical protein C0J52_03731 [Blattella germanica]
MESEAERSSGSTVSPGPYAGSGITACSPASPYFLDSALPSDSDHNYDHHSSEEELEVINNVSSAPACAGTAMPEKRKWSQVTGGGGGGGGGSLSNSCTNPCTLTIAGTSCSSSSVSCSVGGRASVAVITTDQSSGSSDEEVQGLLAAMATPVQFTRSPPLDAHKPGRSLSPPPKLFHYGGHDVSPRKRHRHTPRAHHIQRPCLDFEKMQQVSFI